MWTEKQFSNSWSKYMVCRDAAFPWKLKTNEERTSFKDMASLAKDILLTLIKRWNIWSCWSGKSDTIQDNLILFITCASKAALKTYLFITKLSGDWAPYFTITQLLKDLSIQADRFSGIMSIRLETEEVLGKMWGHRT